LLGLFALESLANELLHHLLEFAEGDFPISIQVNLLDELLPHTLIDHASMIQHHLDFLEVNETALVL
jgi:hypothetical protein